MKTIKGCWNFGTSAGAHITLCNNPDCVKHGKVDECFYDNEQSIIMSELIFNYRFRCVCGKYKCKTPDECEHKDFEERFGRCE